MIYHNTILCELINENGKYYERSKIRYYKIILLQYVDPFHVGTFEICISISTSTHKAESFHVLELSHLSVMVGNWGQRWGF